MAKQKRGRPKQPDKPVRVPWHLEVPPEIKERMKAVADRNDRKQTAEAIRAFREYLERHEKAGAEREDE